MDKGTLLYLFFSKNENNKFPVVKIDVNKQNEYEYFEIGLDGHNFFINSDHPNEIFFIESNSIYRQELSNKKPQFGSLFESESSKLSDTFKGMASSKKLFGAKLVFETQQECSFYKFEQSNKFFVCNDGDILKRISVETGDILNIYDFKKFEYHNIDFSNDNSIIFA